MGYQTQEFDAESGEIVATEEEYSDDYDDGDYDDLDE